MRAQPAHTLWLMRTLAFVLLLGTTAQFATAKIMRFEFSINGVAYDPIDVRMFDSAMPDSVSNFQDYADDDSWAGTFLHRRSFHADSGVAVLQGGGYSIPETGMIGQGPDGAFLDLDQLEAKRLIDDEPGGGVQGISNLRGTIANAKSGPDTASTQWYFNLTDNTNLDNPNQPSGGFSAFGRVIGNGMEVVDNISSLTVVNFQANLVTNVPLLDLAKVNEQNNLFSEDVVLVERVWQLPYADGDYNFDGTVNLADYTVWRDTLGSESAGEADGNGDGMVDQADYEVWRSNFGVSVIATADYNGDGMVNLADYTLWRDSLGSTDSLDADGNGDGVVDAIDYSVWKLFFGKVVPQQPQQLGLHSQGVPEPSSVLLAVAMLSLGVCWQRIRARGT